MEMINLVTTFLPDTDTIITGTIKIFVAINAIALTYILSSYLLRPNIIFKMRKIGNDYHKRINFSTRGEISQIYKLYPILIYKKIYTAKFLCIDYPNEEYPEFTLPFHLSSLRASIEDTYENLLNIDNNANDMYIEAERMSDRIIQLRRFIRRNNNDINVAQEIADNDPEIIECINWLRNYDNDLDEINYVKAGYVCFLRKQETILMMYDFTYTRKPTFDWEED